MTLRGVDSSWEPTATQVATAKAHGIGAWLGYFKLGDDGLLNGWADATFDLVRAGGLETAAFCSTRADQATLKARAAALGIVLVSDVESSVNGGDGSYVDPALAVSAAGLYGGGPRGDGTVPRHLPHNHTRYVVSDYELCEDTIGRGSLSWPPNDARPAAGIPVGWQYQGSTAMPWGETDLAVYDDTFFLPTPAPVFQEVPVFIAQGPTAQGDYLVFDNGLSVPIGASATVTAFAGSTLKVPVVPVDAEFIAGLKALLITGATGGLTATEDAELSAVSGKVEKDLA